MDTPILAPRRVIPGRLAALGLLLLLAASARADWPQAAGPDGNWQAHGPAAPVRWSVARDENILWRTPLPNGGQSGIAVAGGRIFLTTFDVYKEGDPKMSGTILGHCLDAATGKILWSVKLQGPTPSPMLYAYSDSTSPSPIADGQHVWFFNASGEMGCWDYAGREIWRRSYTPWGRPFPFNKQHEPIRFGDVILNVEPPDGNPADKYGWNYLRAIDVNTGRTRWIADDGTTTYCTSVLGRTADGRPAVLTGRGGWHNVPERPVGLSLIDLSPGHEGRTIWRYVADTDADGQPLKEPGSLGGPTWQALYTLHWDAEHAYWFRLNPEETHLVIDSRTGRLEREQSLIRGVDYRQWDPAAHDYIVHRNVNLREMRELAPGNLLAPDEVIRVMPAWSCNLVVDGYHYFLTTSGKGRNDHPPRGRAGPSHCIARVNLATGRVEYLEVPVTVIRPPGQPDEPIYGLAQRTTTLNASGQDVAQEDRSRTDGWEIPAFWGNAVAVNDRLYVTTMLGITYVIDARAPVLDANALLAINDLGPAGGTWSLNTLSYDRGRIYHRSLKELVCIAEQTAPRPALPPEDADPNRPHNVRLLKPGVWTDDAGHDDLGNVYNQYRRSATGTWSNYDEAKANPFPLPDPLRLKDGRPVTDADTWWKERRPEILQDFLTEVYGRIPADTPKITWEVATTGDHDGVTTKKIVGRIDHTAYPATTPVIELTLTLPAHRAGPVPVLVAINTPSAGDSPHRDGRASPQEQVLARGWGYATFNPVSVQPDNAGGLNAGIIGLMNRGRPRQDPAAWGALSAWAWGLSRAADYFATDADVDAHRLGVEGHSRWGKTALWAAALDVRWAIVYTSCSGEGGAKPSRRNYGETADNIAGSHWMAGNFRQYAGRWNDLPVDAHELIALVAPRPVLVTGATQDPWADPRGEFLAVVGAGPVYRLLGKKDTGTTAMPAPDVALTAGDVAFREHIGPHSDLPDWPVFLDYAARYFTPSAGGK